MVTRCAQVVDGRVTNLLEAEPATWNGGGQVVPVDSSVHIGDAWDGRQFLADPVRLRKEESARAALDARAERMDKLRQYRDLLKSGKNLNTNQRDDLLLIILEDHLAL